METLERVEKVRERIGGWRSSGARIALVPTMGNLHPGHLTLVERAKTLADRCVATIFVNPLQFGPGEDFDSYPRTLEQDRQRLMEAGVDLLFAPPVEEIYPAGASTQTRVEVPGWSGLLCGASRPGHFTGVTTVVCKLFNMVQPDLAIFGEKDYQQLLIIKRMVSDLAIPIEVLGAPTVREEDGLAMSSRNSYLSAEERRQAPLLHQVLLRIRDAVLAGESDYEALEQEGRGALERAGFRVDYLTLLRADELTRPAPGDSGLMVFGAVYLGATRLIDNEKIS
jgi:pantoate--beta-alanine ligase